MKQCLIISKNKQEQNLSSLHLTIAFLKPQMFNETIVQSIMNICIFNLFTTTCIFVNFKVTPNGNGNSIKVIFPPCIILSFMIMLCMITHAYKMLTTTFLISLHSWVLNTCFKKPQNCVLQPCTLPPIIEFFILKFMHNLHKHQPSWINAINKTIFE